MSPSSADQAAGRRQGWAAATLLAGVIALGALGGCGSDDGATSTATSSTTTASSTTSTASTSTTSAETTSTSPSGGTGSYDAEEDTAGNDIPPPSGSAAEEFEERCERKPASCG